MFDLGIELPENHIVAIILYGLFYNICRKAVSLLAS